MTTGDTDSSTACYRNRTIRQQQREQWLLETQTHQQHAAKTEQWSNSSVSNDYSRHDSPASFYRNRAMKQQQHEQWLLETHTHQQHATGTEQWSNSSMSNDYWRHTLTSSMLQEQSNKAKAAWAMTTGDTHSPAACYRNRAIRQQQSEQCLLETHTHQQYATGTEQWSNISVSNDYWRHRLTSIMLQKQSNKATAAWAMTTGDTDSPASCYRNRAIRQQQHEQWLLETETRQQHATGTEQWSNSSMNNDY